MSYQNSQSGCCGYSGSAFGGAVFGSSSSYSIGSLGYYERSGLEGVVQYSAAASSYSAVPVSSVSYPASILGYSASNIFPDKNPADIYAGHSVLEQNSFYGRSEMAMYAVRQFNPVNMEYAFIPDDFLKPDRQSQPFIGDAKEIEEAVIEAFEKTMGMPFPSDIRVAVLKYDDFRKQAAHPGVVGFSINRKEHGLVCDAVACAGDLDKVLLTIGHEIGHVLTLPLKNKRDEEAKAFAFSKAWMDAIREHNISGLKDCIVSENPANNGLHDVACRFVWSLFSRGKKALDVYWRLVNGLLGVDKQRFNENDAL